MSYLYMKCIATITHWVVNKQIKAVRIFGRVKSTIPESSGSVKLKGSELSDHLATPPKVRVG